MPQPAPRGLVYAFLLSAFCGIAMILLAVANHTLALALFGTLFLAVAVAAGWRLRDHPLRALLP